MGDPSGFTFLYLYLFIILCFGPALVTSLDNCEAFLFAKSKKHSSQFYCSPVTIEMDYTVKPGCLVWLLNKPAIYS